MTALPHEATIHDLILAYVNANSDESTPSFVKDDLRRSAENIIIRNTSREIDTLAKQIAQLAQARNDESRTGYDIAVGAILAFSHQKRADQKVSIIHPAPIKSRNPTSLPPEEAPIEENLD